MGHFRLGLGMAVAGALLCLPSLAQSQARQPASATYQEHLQRAKALLKENKLPEALAEAQAAAKLDPKGYEAPAAAALIFHAANKPAQAKAAIADALKLAPADKRQEVEEIAKLVGAAVEATPATAPSAAAAAASAKLTGPARRQMDTLLLIIEDADRAKLADERKKLLREFLDKSEPFVKEHPDQLSIWTLRAVAAIELGQKKAGWEAGRQMIRLGAENSEDAKTRKVLAALDRKGWLVEQLPVVDYAKLDMTELRAAAQEGDSAAQRELGKKYWRMPFDEHKMPANDAEGLRWIQAAADGGDSDARVELAGALAWGFHGCKKNPSQAINLARDQANAGQADAELVMGQALLESESPDVAEGKLVGANTEATTATPKTEPTAPAAGKLTGAARRQMDTLLLIIEDADKATTAAERKKLLREFMAKSADFVCENPSQTNIWLLRAVGATELDYPSEGWLAGRRLKGLGLEESEDTKTRKVLAQLDRKGWLGAERKWREWSKWKMEQVKRAAEEGDAEAQFRVGVWYRFGLSGLSQDYLEMLKWYRKAAEAGNAEAQNGLGLAYGKGQGVPKDEVEAVKWYRKAAEAGHPVAQCSLGASYSLGRGAAKDEVEAVKWYRKAAATEELWALNSLARQLATSTDAALRNGKEAVQFATKACELTQSTNHLCLGTLAAAHAEAGSFEDAVKYAGLAIKAADPAKDAAFIKDTEERLKLYENKQPYRARD